MYCHTSATWPSRMWNTRTSRSSSLRPLALARGQMHPDAVPVVGHDVMQLGPEGPGRQLHSPAEEPQDRVDAAVVAGQRAAARELPDDLGVEQLAQGVHVPLANAS
jgi:hypothetical protein